MNEKELVIKPLKSVYRVSNFIRIISLLFLFLTICGLMTEGYFTLLIIQFLIFFLLFVYETIKIIKLKNAVYLLKEEKLITKKETINCKNTKYKTDKHGNLIIFNNNKKIKINRLSYNFDILFALVTGKDRSVNEKNT